MTNRKSGILLHITSLPGNEGIGTLGEEAFRFVDFLKETQQKYWQILPLGPVGSGYSPYQCFSAFAGNPMLIDLQKLVDENLLEKKIIDSIPVFKKSKVEFAKIEKWKYPVLKEAFINFRDKAFDRFSEEYYRFLDTHAWWLNDYSFFMSAHFYFHQKSWHQWEEPIKFRHKKELEKLGSILSEEIDFRKFLQFIFFRQWFALKEYANNNGIEIIGDVPLYVSGNSSDVWANTDLFLLDENLEPTHVGGVPPDYFSETGQLWGNPVFNWERLKERKYDWWMARLHFNLNLFDLVRIDHFRGLESYWSVGAGEKTAVNGKWEPAFGFEMLQLLKSQIGHLPFIAEDLGIITPDVEKLRDDFELPGMKVLQFAFATDPANKDLPHNYTENFVVYTGTHDNDTTCGWLQKLGNDEKLNVEKYLGKPANEKHLQVIELAFGSVAKTVIIPMQDILELDSKARMNTPGTPTGNWDWRFRWNQLKVRQKKFLTETTLKYNR